MENLVFKSEKGTPVTNSLLVAEKFGKRHADVIRAIKDLLSKLPENECKRNFCQYDIRQIPQPNGGFREKPVYMMTKDGFVLLVFGFTGKKAMLFKVDYIAAFNKMESYIKEQKPLSPVEQLLFQAQLMVEQEKRIQLVESRVDEINARTQTRPDYFTIAGYGSLNGVSVNIQLASRLGKKASDICKKRGLSTDEIPDPRFGKVKMYPRKVLDEVFEVPV